MSNLNFVRVRLPASVCFSAVIGLSTFLPPIEKAHAQGECANFLFAGPVISPISGSKVILGQTITVTRFTVSSAVGSCLLTNGEAFYTAPDGTATKVMQGFHITPHESKDCTGTPGNNDAACLGFTNTYVVNAADINRTLTIVMPPRGQFGGLAVTNAGTPNQIHFFAAANADGFNRDGESSGYAIAVGSQRLTVVSPGLAMSKECGTNCFLYGAPITFHGTICNTGDVRLINIIVTDTPPATITFAATTSLGNPFNPATGLSNGECVNYSGSYQPAGSGAALCGPFTDTTVATGTAQGVFLNPTFSATNTATCHVCPSPGCPPAPPVIVLNPSTNGTNFSFTFMTETNRTNTIQFIDSLLLTNWQTLTTFIGVGGITNVEDNVTNTQRFYRVKVE